MKKHGQVERCERVDSFQADGKFFITPSFTIIPFNRDENRLDIKGGKIVKLAHVHNATGRLTFFLCPICGKRVRFLYLPGYECRECARLNYRCQQVTRGTLADISALAKKLGVDVSDNDYESYTLEKPRYMHTARFERYRRRFEKKRILYAVRQKKAIYSLLREYFDPVTGEWL